jgi:hypothetical protein
VNVGRQVVGLVEGADANEPDQRPRARVVAPQGNTTARTASEHLTVSALRWRIDQLGLPTEHNDSIGLDHRVERERRTALALTPAAMTAVHEQRRSLHAIANAPAVAAAFEREPDMLSCERQALIDVGTPAGH